MMNRYLQAIVLMAMLPVSLFAQVNDSIAMDSIADYWDKLLVDQVCRATCLVQRTPYSIRICRNRVRVSIFIAC